MKAVLESVGDGNGRASAHQTDKSAGPLVGPRRDAALTIRELVDLYMADYAGRDSSRPQRLGYWVAALGDVRIGELDDDLVFEAVEALQNRRGRYFAGRDADGEAVFRAKAGSLSSATVNRYQAALSALLTWAIRRRLTPRGWSNPCQHVPLKREKNELVRFLSDAECRALLEAAKGASWPKLYLLVLMAITTGARRGELEALRWRDVDLERAEAQVLRSKNGSRRTLVLVPGVVEELGRHAGRDSALIFASSRRPDVAFNFVPAWKRALRGAGIRRPFRFHDLRHTCASTLAQNGATLLQIADVLGHNNISVTKRYSHLATEHKARLVMGVLGSLR